MGASSSEEIRHPGATTSSQALVASVVIPAHQEERTIARCLEALLAPALSLEIVVVANGCTDRTAEVARGFEGASVLVLRDGSKAAALNAGDHFASVFPRLYVDADVVLTGAEHLLAALQGDRPLLAVPSRRLDVVTAHPLVRGYYRTWERLQECRGDLLGSGVYAVNEAGRARWAEFPAGIADDYHVHSRFEPAERVVADRASSQVRPPRTLSSLLAVRARVYGGNLEHQALHGRLRRPSPVVDPLLHDPIALAGLPVYGVITAWARSQGRRRHRAKDVTWSHDTSSRSM